MALALVLRDNRSAAAQPGDLSLDMDMGDAPWPSRLFDSPELDEICAPDDPDRLKFFQNWDVDYDCDKWEKSKSRSGQ
jgi:hypothetical protein